MPIVATAGHVDHGKSTLIKALTGHDPDRWTEEKQRGLTIDLGFAWTEIGDLDVGFIDVPGHERFIKNMLAGMGAIDVALIVVAADEGWMPQTEEHLSVLDLLGIRHGVIALTRTDLADADATDLAELEILERVEGTVSRDWPIVRVSALTGAGLNDIEKELAAQLAAAGIPLDRGQPRLWIDRAFHISGAGLVVTGTLSEGSVAAGDELMLWPGETAVRVRGIQHHETPVETAVAGSRTALNLAGTDTADRGMLLARPGSVAVTRQCLVSLRCVRSLEDELTDRGAYHLHIGSGAWPVRLRVLAPDVALVDTRGQVPVRTGDRFILRETGRRAVVAGGVVLDPHPPRSRRRALEAASALATATEQGPDGVADVLLSIRATAGLEDLRRDSGGGAPGTKYVVGKLAMDEAAATDLLEQVIDATRRFQLENRLRPGIPKAALATTLRRDVEAVTLVVAGAPGMIDEGATIRTADFRPGLSPEEKDAWHVAQATLKTDLAVPRADQLGLDRELLHALIRDGRLVRISADLVYLPEQVQAIRTAIENLDGEFTVADFRDAIGVSRRQAVPLLEWFDKQGMTRRHGDVRTVRGEPSDT